MRKIAIIISLLALPYLVDAKSCSCTETTKQGGEITISYSTDKGTGCCSPTSTQAIEKRYDSSGQITSSTFIPIADALLFCC